MGEGGRWAMAGKRVLTAAAAAGAQPSPRPTMSFFRPCSRCRASNLSSRLCRRSITEGELRGGGRREQVPVRRAIGGGKSGGGAEGCSLRPAPARPAALPPRTA